MYYNSFPLTILRYMTPSTAVEALLRMNRPEILTLRGLRRMHCVYKEVEGVGLIPLTVLHTHLSKIYVDIRTECRIEESILANRCSHHQKLSEMTKKEEANKYFGDSGSVSTDKTLLTVVSDSASTEIRKEEKLIINDSHSDNKGITSIHEKKETEKDEKKKVPNVFLGLINVSYSYIRENMFLLPMSYVVSFLFAVDLRDKDKSQRVMSLLQSRLLEDKAVANLTKPQEGTNLGKKKVLIDGKYVDSRVRRDVASVPSLRSGNKGRYFRNSHIGLYDDLAPDRKEVDILTPPELADIYIDEIDQLIEILIRMRRRDFTLLLGVLKKESKKRREFMKTDEWANTKKEMDELVESLKNMAIENGLLNSGEIPIS